MSLSPDQEIALGLQAAPEMAQQFGGLAPDPEAQALVDEVGNRLVQQTAAAKTPYRYEFHLLGDDRVIDFPLHEVKRLAGIDVPFPEMKRILGHLGFIVAGSGPIVKIAVPSWL